jgi:hypothetical protein
VGGDRDLSTFSFFIERIFFIFLENAHLNDLIELGDSLDLIVFAFVLYDDKAHYYPEDLIGKHNPTYKE